MIRMAISTRVGKGTGKAGVRDELVLPEGVSASVSGRTVKLKGPNGEASREVTDPAISVSIEGQKAVVASVRGAKKDKTRVESWRAHIANMAKGVTEGHVYKLKVCYTHFPITVTVPGKKLVIKNFLGEKTLKEIELPENVKAKVEGAEIIIESTDKESAGQVAALVEQITRRTNFDTRVFADGIYITMKDGKEIK